MDSPPSTSNALPLGIKIAASYLLLFGVARFIAMPVRLLRASALPPFSGRAVAYYVLSIAIALLLFLTGIALLQRRVTARKMALGMLAYLAFLHARKAAAVLIHGPEHYGALIFTGCLLASTLALLAYLLSRSARAALP